MSEGFIMSTRSACDVLATALGYVATTKYTQVPSSSLRRFINWATKNTDKLRPEMADILSINMDWFWNLRSIRDHIVHGNASATIHCNGHQFNLWVYSSRSGWVTREPLLPLLKNTLLDLINYSDRVAIAVNNVINLPSDRIRSRVVQGVLIPALHRLIEVADEYSQPSP
jgi:hypothetical protein